jgi:hypothetical protein
VTASQAKLRTVIQESLRVQRGSAEHVAFIDTGNVLADVTARQNHVVFGRRGCGKTLLLHYSGKHLDQGLRAVYLNCEDFKRHSFPNVLIEILDALFGELEKHLSGWFGRKKRSRDLITNIRAHLARLKDSDEVVDAAVKTVSSVEGSGELRATVGTRGSAIDASSGLSVSRKRRDETEQTFQSRREKIAALDNWLPELKRQVREFFEISRAVTSVYLQIDDLYHLRRDDQPFVVDYVHRLCKDVPLFFKIATLRHASVLFVSRDGQPIGAQERQDFQPLDIDYTFMDFRKTRDQNKLILREFGKRAGFEGSEVEGLFKGTGFDRLVLAGGGVPRDTLSLFLEVLSEVQSNTDKRIGKDDVRILSKSNFERRIEELKHDSGAGEQEPLIKAIYVIRGFCLERQTNVFLVAERTLQQDDNFRSLVYRLLDYRIIHSGATALTHKSRHREGTFQAFAIDIGCYAHLRKLEGKFSEIDLSARDAKERLRSAPLLELGAFNAGFSSVPANVEEELTAEI